MASVGIYLFDDVEVLDFAGPFEVFSVASRVHATTGHQDLFTVFTISDEARSVRARGGLAVSAQHSFRSHPPIDVLIVPGGDVTAELGRLTASVCTGALLLAAATLLDGKRATTHWEDIDQLRRDFPAVRVEAGPRWIDEGEVVTSAGISAGIDMSLHLVRRLAGPEVALRTARQMDFEWTDRGS